VAGSFNHFDLIAARLTPACAEIAAETAWHAVSNIQQHIIANGQVDTGDMLNSVAVADGDTPTTKDIIIGMDYWVYQNYGTRYMPARPFVEPGIEDTRAQFEAAGATLEKRIT